MFPLLDPRWSEGDALTFGRAAVVNAQADKVYSLKTASSPLLTPEAEGPLKGESAYIECLRMFNAVDRGKAHLIEPRSLLLVQKAGLYGAVVEAWG